MTNLELARSNLSKSSDAPTPEWRLTMIFYAVFHAVSHKRWGPKGNPSPFGNHIEQLDWIGSRMSVIEDDYRTLMELSWVARYKPQQHPMESRLVQPARDVAERIFRATGVPLPKD